LPFLSSGADFIKTSTGKEGVNAILPVGLVMVRAIREYFQRTGYKVNCGATLSPNCKLPIANTPPAYGCLTYEPSLHLLTASPPTDRLPTY